MRIDLPKLEWVPVNFEPVPDIEAKACEYTNRQRAFAVYASGTVVFSDSSVQRPDGDYHATLVASALKSPDFTVMPMQDTNYLIRFSGPVAGIVLFRFWQYHSNSIKSSLVGGGYLPGEKLIAPQGTPEDQYWIGLFARAKLYADVGSQEIASRFIP